jgi:hypothetical protein
MSLPVVDNAVAALLCDRDPATHAAVHGTFKASAVSGGNSRPAFHAPLGTLSTAFGGGTPTAVPVIRFTPRGARAVETWPCVSYEIVGSRPDLTRWRVRDPIRADVPGAQRTLMLADASTVTGGALARVRAMPDPEIVTVNVSCWSLDEFEILWLAEAVKARMPIRFALPIVWSDGSEYTFQVVRTGDIAIPDPEPMTETADGRGIQWVFSYDVSTWRDNTRDARVVTTIRFEPEITLSALTTEDS